MAQQVNNSDRAHDFCIVNCTCLDVLRRDCTRSYVPCHLLVFAPADRDGKELEGMNTRNEEFIRRSIINWSGIVWIHIVLSLRRFSKRSINDIAGIATNTRKEVSKGPVGPPLALV